MLATISVSSTNLPLKSAPLEKVESPALPIVTALPTLNSPPATETPASNVPIPASTLRPPAVICTPLPAVAITPN